MSSWGYHAPCAARIRSRAAARCAWALTSDWLFARASDTNRLIWSDPSSVHQTSAGASPNDTCGTSCAAPATGVLEATAVGTYRVCDGSVGRTYVTGDAQLAPRALA